MDRVVLVQSRTHWRLSPLRQLTRGPWAASPSPTHPSPQRPLGSLQDIPTPATVSTVAAQEVITVR
ncbi:hypothetical protein M9458_023623, partial [Cirrhinus mrigala]